VDESGKIIVRDKALLSLKDYNLRGRLRELAEAGITSFKIEGRLKNESYVRNVVRDYSLEIDRLVASDESFERVSWGRIAGGFTPDTSKTFNRGYTELFIDGQKGSWASMDAAKGMGEEVGDVISLDKTRSNIGLRLKKAGLVLNNGDGFSFVSRGGDVCGFRGDVCSGNTIRCKSNPELFIGAKLFRNIDIAFEKEIERNPGTRELTVGVTLDCRETGRILVSAQSEDGRCLTMSFDCGDQIAENRERMQGMFASQIGKSVGHYRFNLESLISGDKLPFVSASALNGIRRSLAEELDKQPCNKKDILHRRPGRNRENERPATKNVTYKENVSNALSEQIYKDAGATISERAFELTHRHGAELMRTRYCIKHELGLCPKQPATGKKPIHGKLFLLNNGQKFALHFDCAACEMTVCED
jgi:putative protease